MGTPTIEKHFNTITFAIVCHGTTPITTLSDVYICVVELTYYSRVHNNVKVRRVKRSQIWLKFPDTTCGCIYIHKLEISTYLIILAALMVIRRI